MAPMIPAAPIPAMPKPRASVAAAATVSDQVRRAFMASSSGRADLTPLQHCAQMRPVGIQRRCRRLCPGPGPGRGMPLSFLSTRRRRPWWCAKRFRHGLTFHRLGSASGGFITVLCVDSNGFGSMVWVLCCSVVSLVLWLRVQDLGCRIPRSPTWQMH